MREDIESMTGTAIREVRPLPAASALIKQPADKFPADFCPRCGAKEVRRLPGTVFHKFLAIHPHACVLCSAQYIKFQFSFLCLVTFLVLVGLGMGVRYLAMNPLLFSREDGARINAQALARARANTGGLSPFEELMTKKSRSSLDNASVLKLWKAHVSSSVIVKMIQTSIPDYDISANSIIELEQDGVDEGVILAMIDATYSAR